MGIQTPTQNWRRIGISCIKPPTIDQKTPALKVSLLLIWSINTENYVGFYSALSQLIYKDVANKISNN
jgi:hypothetical protein